MARGKFDKILFMDAETTGLAFNSDDPSYDAQTKTEYQSVSWGFVVADATTLKPIDKLYVEIKWNGKSEWSDRAEEVHGLSKEYLEENGLTEEEAACEIATFVLEHFDPDKPVCCGGHNVATFDKFFLQRLMRKFDIMFKTGNRFIDTNSVGFACYGTYNSDDLFDLVGIKRNKHNALEDAMAALKVVYKTRALYSTILSDN